MYGLSNLKSIAPSNRILFSLCLLLLFLSACNKEGDKLEKILIKGAYWDIEKMQVSHISIEGKDSVFIDETNNGYFHFQYSDGWASDVMDFSFTENGSLQEGKDVFYKVDEQAMRFIIINGLTPDTDIAYTIDDWSSTNWEISIYSSLNPDLSVYKRSFDFKRR